MSNDLELFDVTIIGGGPAGMYTAFYSGMRDLKTKVIEFNPRLGGKILLYPEKMIWDVGGLTPTMGENLVAQLEQQTKTFEPTIVLGQQVVDLERAENGHIILTANTGERHLTKTVILAMGHGIPKMAKLEIEGADRYEVTNLHYTVQELEIFRGKKVVISGGGNSAVDWANELAPIADVTVVHRRDLFGGHEKNVERMKASVDVRTPFALSELHGNGSSIEEVTITEMESGKQERLKVDAVIVNHGMRGDLSPLMKWGLELQDGLLAVNEKMETNIPGVFGAGDLVTHASKVRLIAGTFVDGVNALNSAKLYIDPEAEKVAYVSSHNERFKEKNKKLGVEV
ncbi:NAD(P)/FAD-dependent oxidoreductase [Bacillus horti]|uniref:Ferredoxin--NADP reductase n=1 Tax=Caldalkalibacillus horti TaxID=77523 RepID=A0ABT9VX89_9BACI|nr:NAD(P)/FAD-dependent oxidoreductase [Bacillus horti]MDQ0165607.1 thioredoxin reductase (NADPH) [Bacillus horti]